MNLLTLTAPHPYYPVLGDVTLTVPLLSSPPGKAIANLAGVPVSELRLPDSWTPLTTDYVTTGFAARAGQTALLALLWDLTGQPIHPTHRPRPATPCAVVTGSGGRVVVWRRTCDLRFSADEKTNREREDHVGDLSRGRGPVQVRRKESAV
jgi:hypothetical protein